VALFWTKVLVLRNGRVATRRCEQRGDPRAKLLALNVIPGLRPHWPMQAQGVTFLLSLLVSRAPFFVVLLKDFLVPLGLLWAQ